MVLNNMAIYNNELMQVTSSDSIRQTILCIVKDLTDPKPSCKTEVFNLQNTLSVSQFIEEVSNRYMYEQNSFKLMWKSGNDYINLSQLGSMWRTLSDIGLLDSNSKNIFEIHEQDGMPVRKCRNEIGCDASPIIYDLGTYPSTSTSFIGSQSSFSPINDLSDSGYAGLINQAATCYLNSLLQTLYMTPEFRNAIYRWKFLRKNSNDETESKKNIPYQLQKLFLNMQTTNKRSLQTHDLTLSFGWGNDDAFQQHDVQELCRVMFDALEITFKGTQQENLINELYQGKIKDYVKCMKCNTESARIDVFLDIQLSIKEFGSTKVYDSVESALDAHIQCEQLDGQNKYFCNTCNELCDAQKGLKFASFPYILCIQLKRFDFDYQNMTRVKLSTQVSFPELLDVRKYLNDESVGASTDTSLKTEYELFSIMIHSGSATG